jgi:hypothetical protein
MEANLKTSQTTKKDVRVARNGENYHAVGADALLLGFHLKIPIFGKKISGNCIYRLQFHAIRLNEFERQLGRFDLQLTVTSNL